MQDKLNDIRQAVRQRLDKASQSSHIEELRVSVLGRKGELTALLKGMGKLSPEERPLSDRRSMRCAARSRIGSTSAPANWRLVRKKSVSRRKRWIFRFPAIPFRWAASIRSRPHWSASSISLWAWASRLPKALRSSRINTTLSC